MTQVGKSGNEPHLQQTAAMQETQDSTRGAPAPATTPAQPSGGGAAAAFEEAYVRFAPRLQRIAIRRFGVPAAEAEVLVQDVFTTYFQHAARVHALEPYLIGAICNASRNYLRRSSASEALFFCGEHPCAATPDDALLRELERKTLLAQMLARVGQPCRDLLRRYYVNGEGTEALAGALGLVRGSVKVKLFKCRQRALDAYRALMEKSMAKSLEKPLEKSHESNG